MRTRNAPGGSFKRLNAVPAAAAARHYVYGYVPHGEPAAQQAAAAALVERCRRGVLAGGAPARLA